MSQNAPIENDVAEPVRRFVEFEAQARDNALRTLVVVAAAGIWFRSYGALFVIAAVLPLIGQIGRYRCRTPISKYRYEMFYLVLTGACVATVALATGGAQSPLLLFSVMIGMGATLAFPHVPAWGMLPILIIGAVVLIDWIDGGWDGGLLMPVAATIVSAMVPQLAGEGVQLELSFRRKAVLDPLTGCLNRTSMDTRLSELEAQAQRSGDHIGVIAIDIDHFKRVNDELGHTKGDEALQGVAYAVRKELRRFELMYRTGGEEFVLIIPGASLDETVELAERIRRAVSRNLIVGRRLTISVGVASAASPESIESLLDEADTYLYQAKRAGRDRVEFSQAA